MTGVLNRATQPPYRIFLCIAFFISCLALWGQTDLSYEELVDLALKNGLETTGNRLVLKERLRDILGTELPSSERVPSPDAPRAEVEKSDSGTYLQKSQGDELELQGNVTIKVAEEGSSLTHSISADLILYNQDLGQLSAQGNVTYVMSGESREDYFTGNRLLFLLDENESLFVDGGGKRDAEPSNEAFSILQSLKSAEKVEYYYTGKFISRNQDNVIIMDEGFITSSRSASPNYRLNFKKVWILSPGEWGVEDAVLYVGNIPLFGLPYLYLPGNEIIFHPVFLYDDIRGLGLQTTTYLVGRKETAESPFSFLQASGDADSYSPMGIFLQPDSNPEPEPEGSNAFESAKLYADIYSIRGFILGLGLDFTPSDVADAETFFLLALTREIYDRGNDMLTSQYSSATGEMTSIWHESRFAGITIPLRFILDLQFSLSLPAFSIGLTLPIYSDPFIQNEFSERGEDIPWNNLLLGGESGTQSLAFSQSSMSWDMQVSLSPELPAFFKPLFNSFSISNISSRFIWDTARPADFPVEHATAVSSPERLYYVPKQIQFPSGTTAVSGTLLRIPGEAPVEEDPVWDEIADNIGSFQLPDRATKEPASRQEEENTVEDQLQGEEQTLSPPRDHLFPPQRVGKLRATPYRIMFQISIFWPPSLKISGRRNMKPPTLIFKMILLPRLNKK